MYSRIVEIALPMVTTAALWVYFRRLKERNKVRIRRTEAIEIMYLVQDLAAVLKEFVILDELHNQIANASESELQDILHVTYNSLSPGEKSPLLLDGENDRGDFLMLLERKEQRYLTQEIPYYLTQIFETTWTLRDSYIADDDETDTDDDETDTDDDETDTDDGETDTTKKRNEFPKVKCCMCSLPANLIVFKYAVGEYIPPYDSFYRDDIPDIMEWEHAWFTACSKGCAECRVEQARESGEFNDADFRISVKAIKSDNRGD